jgi:hypothetical protein
VSDTHELLVALSALKLSGWDALTYRKNQDETQQQSIHLNQQHAQPKLPEPWDFIASVEERSHGSGSAALRGL